MTKTVFVSLLLCLFVLTASSQVVESKKKSNKAKIETRHSETKVKKTATAGQRVHNILHPKRKHYSGVRIKHEAKKD